MYILRCVDNTYYTGSTIDLIRRLKEHTTGCGSRYTSIRLPVELIYFEAYDRISHAYYREKQIQDWTKEKTSIDKWRNKRTSTIGEKNFQEILDSPWYSNLHDTIQTEIFDKCVHHCKQNIISTINNQIHEETMR